MAERITQEYAVDFSQADKGLEAHIGLWQRLGIEEDRIGKQTPFRKNLESLIKYNNELQSGGVLYKQIANNQKSVKAEVTRLTQEYFKLINAQERSTRSGNWKQVEADIQRVRARLLELNAVQQQVAGAAGGGGGLGGMLGGVLGGGLGAFAAVLGGGKLLEGAKELLTNIVSVRAETQKLEKQLEVTLGGKGIAQEALKTINEFAAKTPHEVAGVTQAFNRLVDVGILPTQKQLFQISDIAVAKGKSMMDYVEAIADAQQGEFERLKEFSVRASKSGDQINFTFKGVTTTVKNTTSAINDYLLSLGDVAGIQGQTAEAGKTLEGRWSTLKDTGRAFANEIGTALQPALEATLDLLQKGADSSLDFFKAMKLVMSDQGFWKTVAQFATGDFVGLAEGFASAATKEAARENLIRRRRSRRGLDPNKTASDDKREAMEAEQQRNEALQKQREADQKAADEAKKAGEKRKQEQERINLDLKRAQEEQLKEKIKLQEELKEVERKYDRERLNLLDKGSAEYLNLKSQIDAEEIELERKKLIELGKIATGTEYYNTKTKRTEIKPNEDYKLPGETEAIFRQRQRDARISNIADYADIQRKQQQERADKMRQATLDAVNNQIDSVEFSQKKALFDAEQKLRRKAGESEIDFEKRKNAELLKIRMDYAQKLLIATQFTGDDKQVFEIEKYIADLREQIKKNDKVVGGPQSLFDLLGIKVEDTDLNVFRQAADITKQAFSEILNQQIESEQQRIDSYDRQIDAKQREIDVELELSRRGLANNLLVKRQEQQQLEAERKKAVESQRRYQQIQLAMNATEQASEITLAIAKLIKSGASLGPLGVIASGISIAAMLGMFVSSVAKARALPKYHTGGEVLPDGVEVAGRGPDEVDARLMVGEGVIRKESYQPNKTMLDKVNALGRKVTPYDLQPLVMESVEMNNAVNADIAEFLKQNQGAADTVLHSKIDSLNDEIRGLRADMNKPQPTRQQIGHNKWKVDDGKGNITIETYTA